MQNEIVKEMARDICRVTLNCNDVCNPVKSCVALKYAERAYEAGRRKQSEGEWIIHADDFDICATEFVCSHCNESYCSGELTDDEFLKMMKYCPNCGAKMKGGQNEQ